MPVKRNPHIRNGKAFISMTLDTDQVKRLDEIASARRCDRSVLLRQAVDIFLAVNSSHTPSPVSATIPSEAA